ncbi:MAG: septum formation initiator family protein [Bacteriovoracaceae bacterium]
MNPSNDEYEEVESPFASSPAKGNARDKLRARKNVFNRPFAAEPSVAPAVFETTSTRKSIAHADQADFINQRQSDLSDTEIAYLDEEDLDEEEEVEKRPAKTSPKKSVKTKKNILAKIGWWAISLLILRLIFMDRGVWDYFSTESDIREKQNELKSIQAENRELKTEISRIQLDRNYQRQLAKEHLGVIAADEFLILFAGESSESESTPNNQL